MTAVRVASPEGWQVSVRFSFFGVAREVLVIVCARAEPDARTEPWLLGVVGGARCCGRGEPC